MQRFALGLLIASGVALFAQSDRGSITGIVSDATTAPIPAANVSATNQGTGVRYSATTSQSGNYVVPQLPTGRYDLAIEAAGFKRYVRKDVDVNVAQTINLNVTLDVGQVEQQVEVIGNAPVVESATSDVGTVVSSRSIIDLPLSVSGNMRNPESFIFLTPGVTGDPTNTQINGSPSRGKEILLDGGSAASPESGGLLFTYPSVEALAEFKLVGSNYSAEYGRTGGGFEVFTTKSGTNDFHGAIFDYLRNDAFDARGFFARSTPVNRQNEFGAVLGGPIIKNRTFFHFVYSGFRYKAGAVNELLSIPPEDFRRGDFSRLVDRNGRQIPIYDPATTKFENGQWTRQQFPGNIIPQNRFSSVAQKIVAELPPTSNAGLLNNFLAVGAQTFDRDQVTIKIDHSFSDRNRISGFAYIGAQSSVEPERLPEPFSPALNEDRPSRWIRINHDYIFSPTTLNHLILSYTREVQSWRRLSTDQDWPNKLGLKGVLTTEGNTFPMMTFTDGYSNWGDFTTAMKSIGVQANNVLQISDNVSHVRGKHTIKFGGDARWMQTNGADLAGSQGRFDFRNLETALPTTEGRASSGNAFASLLLGAVDSAKWNLLAVVPGNRYRYLATFFQDDWKVTSKLTLNLGLRYEIFFPRTERFNNLSGFDPTLPNPGAGNTLGAIAFLGDGPGRNGMSSFADTWYKGFGPRVGFAYSLTPKTVLRGGYGLSYAPGNATAGLRSSQRFGFGFNYLGSWETPDVGITPALSLDAGIPQDYVAPPYISPTVANGLDVDYIARDDGRPPYFQNFTFGIQRELPGSVLVEASYVGVKGTRLGTNMINMNELDPKYLNLGSPLLNSQMTSQQAIDAGIPLPYAEFRGTVRQALRPYPQYLNIFRRSEPNGNSTYHALQTKVDKRFSNGFSLLAAYTWSKTISDADILAGLGPSGQTYYNRSLEKAISTNDVPHNFALSYVYELPFGPGKRFLNTRGVVGRIAGGWTLTGIHQYSSGRPIVLTANNTLPLFNGLLRPDVIGGVPRRLETGNFDPATDLWINPAAFAIPQGLRFGTAARSYSDLRQPGYLNESFGLIKRTPITERVLLTFRAEFFNAFNRVALGTSNAAAPPEGNRSNANFGKLTRQANTPRQGQLALRLEF